MVAEGAEAVENVIRRMNSTQLQLLIASLDSPGSQYEDLIPESDKASIMDQAVLVRYVYIMLHVTHASHAMRGSTYSKALLVHLQYPITHL